MVDECAFGARFAAQFPPTEIFLNRVGNIGLTGLVVGRENGRERCATIVEAFLKEQVENGSFKLQEEEDGDAHATISTVTAGEEVTERVKRLRIDENATRVLKNINRHITANDATPMVSKAPAVTSRPSSLVAAGLMRPEETEPLTIKLTRIKQQYPICSANCQESTPIIIKQEPSEQQLGLYIAEHKHVEPFSVKQEPNRQQLDFYID
jgi:hypothetical protein